MKKKNHRGGGISRRQLSLKYKLKLSQRLRASGWELEIEKQKKSSNSSPTSEKTDSFEKKASVYLRRSPLPPV